jgi:hypothetical protein
MLVCEALDRSAVAFDMWQRSESTARCGKHVFEELLAIDESRGAHVDATNGKDVKRDECRGTLRHIGTPADLRVTMQPNGTFMAEVSDKNGQKVIMSCLVTD